MLPIKFTSLVISILVLFQYTQSATHLSPSAENKSSLKQLKQTRQAVCNLSQSLIAEISNYTNVANQIFNTVLNGPFKGKTYNDLAYFVDKFGSRLAGTDNLEHSIDYMKEKMTQDGLENVHGEDVQIPQWRRGYENAMLVKPRMKNIAILGLGLSIGTTPVVIIAEVLVVKTFDELKKNAAKAQGKIVVFNQDYQSYHQSAEYRRKGPVEASKYGAVACLVRSVTDQSINSPHTGTVVYDKDIKKIPAASITVEDAQFLNRLQNRGETMSIHLTMIDFNLWPTTSRNLFGEIRGREKPEEVVIVSGHIDSWDVGQGAMDDGGGMFVSQEALAVLKFLNLRPRRTIRAILWTTEELGLYGVNAYIKQHKNELVKINAAFESDIGAFKPLGLDFNGSDEAGCIVQEVLKLMAPINATTYRTITVTGTDIDALMKEAVPGVSLNTQSDRYFWYHHTEADTMSVQNTDDMDLCTALWTAASYVIADLSVSLPRAK